MQPKDSTVFEYLAVEDAALKLLSLGLAPRDAGTDSLRS